MGYDVLSQEEIFMYACVLGALLGVLYDMFRIVRLADNWKAWQIFLQDILYFVISGLITFVFLLTFNNGIVRIHVICGELMGWIVYYITIGEIVYRCSSGIIGAVKKAVKKIFIVILNPIVNIFKIIKCKLHSKNIKKNKM